MQIPVAVYLAGRREIVMYVVDIEEAAPDPELQGGKGSSLVHLARVPGIRVPPGFIFTTEAYRRTVRENGLDGEIEVLAEVLRAWMAAGAAGDEDGHIFGR